MYLLPPTTSQQELLKTDIETSDSLSRSLLGISVMLGFSAYLTNHPQFLYVPEKADN